MAAFDCANDSSGADDLDEGSVLCQVLSKYMLTAASILPLASFSTCSRVLLVTSDPISEASTDSSFDSGVLVCCSSCNTCLAIGLELLLGAFLGDTSFWAVLVCFVGRRIDTSEVPEARSSSSMKNRRLLEAGGTISVISAQ